MEEISSLGQIRGDQMCIRDRSNDMSRTKKFNEQINKLKDNLQEMESKKKFLEDRNQSTINELKETQELLKLEQALLRLRHRAIENNK